MGEAALPAAAPAHHQPADPQVLFPMTIPSSSLPPPQARRQTAQRVGAAQDVEPDAAHPVEPVVAAPSPPSTPPPPFRPPSLISVTPKKKSSPRHPQTSPPNSRLGKNPARA